MPIAVTTDLVDANLSEATTNYAVIGTFATAIAASPDTFVQGSNTVGGRVSANSAWAHTSVSTIDLLQNDKHVYQWLKCISIPQLDSKENGGLGITISSSITPPLTGTTPNDGPEHSKTWYVGGSADTLSGWVCYVIDPRSTPSLTLNSPNIAAVRRIGIRAKVVGTVGGGAVKPVNIVFDATRYGTGLTFTGDTAGTPGAFSDILNVAMSTANAWGILTSDSSLYFGTGKFNFGISGQTAVTSFKETNQVFIWRNFPVANTFYNWNVRGSLEFNTTFQIGNYTSNLVSAGCVVKGAGAGTTIATWSLNVATGTTCNLYGSQFSDLYRGYFQSTTTILGCTFNNFGNIITNGATINNCSFQNVQTNAPISGTSALIIGSPAEMLKVVGCSFVNCNRAISIPNAGTYTISGCTFNGNSYDIENASTGEVIINAVNNANPSTYINISGGTTTINNSKILTITNIVNDSEVRIYSAGTTNELGGSESVTTGEFAYSYNYAPEVYVDIVVFKENYNFNEPTGRISSLLLPISDSSLPINQQPDRNFLNP